MFNSLVTAAHAEGVPKVVKLIKSGVLPAGSSELPGGTEAAAVRAICMAASKVCVISWTRGTGGASTVHAALQLSPIRTTSTPLAYHHCGLS